MRVIIIVYVVLVLFVPNFVSAQVDSLYCKEFCFNSKKTIAEYNEIEKGFDEAGIVLTDRGGKGIFEIDKISFRLFYAGTGSEFIAVKIYHTPDEYFLFESWDWKVVAEKILIHLNSQKGIFR